MLIAEKDKAIIKIDNGILLAEYSLTDHVFSIYHGNKCFLKAGQFEKGRAATAKIIELDDNLGVGRAVEVEFDSGCTYRLALYEDLPFICVNLSIRNSENESIIINKIAPFTADVDLSAPAEDLRVLCCDGLDSGDKPRSSYLFLSIAEPKTRTGIICGWLTQNRGSGIVSSAAMGNLINIEARLEYGRLMLNSGESAEGEILAVGFFDDALNGLEAYADAIAKANSIALPEAPSGYCTWYHARALDEKRMAELAEFCSNNLRQYGFDFLQIDDGWQIGRRDFTTYNPEGAYPSGMRTTADVINVYGFKAGLWLTPFGWDHERPEFEEHQDWFVKREDGSVYSVHWGGDCLDMSHPDAREFLRGVIERVTKEYGYEYLKLDALWTGVAVRILYPEAVYREDGLGDAIFHDPAITNIEAFRSGLKLVREAAGEDVFLLGCTVAQNMRTLGGSLGLVDALRIGRDIGAKWSSILSCAGIASHLYFLNGKAWYNDPDCLMLRDPLTLEQARVWGSWISISGQLNVVSEWLPGLPPEKLEVIKRTMPNHQKVARPIDLFESPIPNIWQLQSEAGDGRHDIIGLFNWDTESDLQINVNMEKLGLAADQNTLYIGYDFWHNGFVPPFAGQIKTTLPPGSCRIISIRQLMDHPQVVSTSRHVTQGIVDLSGENWNAEKNLLSGTSQIVGRDPYEIRVFAPNRQAVSVNASGQDISARMEQSGAAVYVTIDSPENAEVCWSITFNGLIGK